MHSTIRHKHTSEFFRCCASIHICVLFHLHNINPNPVDVCCQRMDLFEVIENVAVKLSLNYRLQYIFTYIFNKVGKVEN